MHVLQMGIPKLLLDSGVLNAWTMLFLKLYERLAMMLRPVDPDAVKPWAWWKLENWIIRILNHLYTWLVLS